MPAYRQCTPLMARQKADADRVRCFPGLKDASPMGAVKKAATAGERILRVVGETNETEIIQGKERFYSRLHKY